MCLSVTECNGVCLCHQQQALMHSEVNASISICVPLNVIVDEQRVKCLIYDFLCNASSGIHTSESTAWHEYIL